MDESNVELGKILNSVANRLQNLSEKSVLITGKPLTLQQYRALHLIFDAYPEGILIRDIGEILGLASKDALSVVEALIKEELAERGMSRKDRRTIIMRPTQKAFEIKKMSDNILGETLSKAFQNVSLKEQQVFAKVLKTIF